MIGTMENAQLAATLESYYGDDNDSPCSCSMCKRDEQPEPATMPDGWEFIGSGCSRNAFRGPDGVVYKVLNRDGDGFYDSQSATSGHYNYDRANVQEFTNYVAYKDKVMPRMRLAECYLWTRTVLAMEYVYGESYSSYGDFNKEKAHLRRISNNSIIDMHGANYVVIDDVMVLFDYSW